MGSLHRSVMEVRGQFPVSILLKDDILPSNWDCLEKDCTEKQLQARLTQERTKELAWPEPTPPESPYQESGPT